ncbi:MAG: amidohydrolase family protein [Acidobacteriota bacterium]
MYGDVLHDAQPVRELIERGLKVHIEGSRPFLEIERYVTRKDDKGRIWGPDHAIDRKTALLMKTRWAARFIAEDDRLGSIEPGKLADLAVLGRDYLKIPAQEISEMPVVATMVGGRFVYEAEAK